MNATMEPLMEKSFFIPTEDEIAGGPGEYSEEKIAEIQANLAPCTGSTQYFAYNGCRLTEGAKIMAELCQAFWLFDAILSHQLSDHVRREEFQSWRLSPCKASRGALLLADDGNEHLLTAQHIPYTDFPLPEGIRLYVRDGVIFLPSEY